MTTPDIEKNTTPEVRLAEGALSASDLPETVIEPSHGGLSLKLRDVWEYRELLVFLAWRDVMVKYKQATLGVAWAVIQPLVTMFLFAFIFGKLAHLPSDGKPYALFTFVALLPWQLFANALTRAGNSLVGNANLLTKVYFPRLIIPMSAVLSGLVDFGIAFLILLGLLLWYGVALTWVALTLPLFTLFALIAALAVGLWLSALNVEYRDVGHIIPFMVQIWMYASPVAYSIELMPAGPWRILFGLNPMVGVIQGFRWALLGGSPPDGLFLTSVGVVMFLLLTGLLNFKRMERVFADVV